MQNQIEHLYKIYNANSLKKYDLFEAPTVIVSDGAYGLSGFDTDTTSPKGLVKWYEPHIKKWSTHATGQTTLWFWNTEIGWATVHPILEKHGWVYQNANVWNKGKAHMAGNVNSKTIKRFPVVTEICAQYTFDKKYNGLSLKNWIIDQWSKSKLPLYKANDACEVSNAASRKYLTKDHLWYAPSADMFEKLANYANQHKPEDMDLLFSLDGQSILTKQQYQKMLPIFKCPIGHSNVWNRSPLAGSERIKLDGKTAHLNQKPLDLMTLIIEASSEVGDVVWEPFGGLCSASLAAVKLKRKAFACEISEQIYNTALKRFNAE